MIGLPVGDTGRKHNDVRTTSSLFLFGDATGDSAEDDEDSPDDCRLLDPADPAEVLHNLLAIPFNVSIAFSPSYALDLSIGDPDLPTGFSTGNPNAHGTAGNGKCFAFNPPNQISPPALLKISGEKPSVIEEKVAVLVSRLRGFRDVQGDAGILTLNHAFAAMTNGKFGILCWEIPTSKL